jgi:cell division protein ZapE
MQSLCERAPKVVAGQIIQDFVVPKRFAHTTFSNYVADPAIPSQVFAKSRVDGFANQTEPKRRLFRRSEEPKAGIYLDGGFGVGKTHLLTALWHQYGTKATYGSFVEYTNLVGALGFQSAVETLAKYELICIDEFELDDPGDTVLMSTLLGQLVARNVRIAVTSNTLPDRLGEGRFAADDFVREIQGLAAHFEIIRIDGPDYRHRNALTGAPPMDSVALEKFANTSIQYSLDDFTPLTNHLSKVHPSAFGALVQDLDTVCLAGVAQLTDQAQALRWVVLIDRLYDREIPIAYSGVEIGGLFSPEMLAGGYRKKYLRALSRASALSREITLV